MYYEHPLTTKLSVKAFCDANFVRNGNGKSTIGFVVYLGPHLLLYKSKKLKKVTRSTALTEVLALIECTEAVKGILLLLQECKIPWKDVEFFCDNKATVSFVLGKQHTRMVNQLTLDELAIRQEFEKRFKLSYIQTDKNIADLFTKPLNWTLFNRHRIKVVSTRTLPKKN